MSATTRPPDVEGRIVHAAIALFSRQGYHGTTTREIARLAGVSEVTVFRYFDHKDQIFWAALKSSFSAVKARVNAVTNEPLFGSPEVVLPEVIGLFVDISTFSPELVRLIAVAFMELRGQAESVCREHLSPVFSSICAYLTKNMQDGRIRNLNPAIATVAIALTVMAQPEISKVVDDRSFAGLGRREAASLYSEFWLHALTESVQ